MWRSLQFCLSFFKSLFQLLSKSTKVFCFYCMKVSTVLMSMFDHFNSVVSIIKARTGIILGPRANDLFLFILIYLPYCLWNTYKKFLRFCKSSWVPALTGFFFFFEKIVSWEHWERLERLQNTLKSSFLLFAKLCWGFFCLGFQLFMSANPLVNNESTSWEENTLSYKTPPERNCLYLTT